MAGQPKVVFTPHESDSLLSIFRTFIKWCHVAILLSGLSISLYNSAGADNGVARALAIVYTVIAVASGLWGWYMYVSRSEIIKRRSGEDLDNIIGPSVICISLAVALCVNFGLRVRQLLLLSSSIHS